MISVIIPTYNGSEVLSKYSLPSLMKQDYANWEALVIDDRSSDDSLEIIRSFANKDSRIRIIEKRENTGLAASLNIGVREANGEAIFILEHDDIWLPQKLSKQKSVLKSALISLCQAVVYDTSKNDLIKINGGNLSCLAFKKEAARFLFPIPEENKRYLGIEDGIITARMEIALADKKILTEDIDYGQDILTIMNANKNTLSGQKNPKEMKRRYSSVISLYGPERGKYKNLDKLIAFWKKHYRYNNIILHLPRLVRTLTYNFVYLLKNTKDKRAINALKKDKKYSGLINYRKSFD